MAELSRTPHALLFSGPRSVGKLRSALWFAEQTLLRSQRQTGKLLPEHEVRNMIRSGSHPDLFLLRLAADKRDITVEQIRELCNHLSLRSYYGGAKIAILDDAHRLSNAAANALLMTLEDPPANTFLILISHAPHRLPATILSRCQSVNFGYLSKTETIPVVRNVAAALKVDEKTAEELLQLCEGSLEPLMISPFLDPFSNTFPELDQAREQIESCLTIARRVKGEVSDLLERGVPAEALALAAKIGASRDQQELTLAALRRGLRLALRQSSGDRLRELATGFFDHLERERLISERNLSADTQLSLSLLSFVNNR